MTIEFENEYVRYAVSSSGANIHFTDRKTTTDYCAHDPASACARVKIAGQYYDADSALYSDGRIRYLPCFRIA